jgi:uncharacterized oxidoreductase
MKLSGNTILITGGSSGIGLQLCKKLVESNKVIICSRSADKLKTIKKEIPKVEIFPCDLSNEEQRNDLVEWIKTNHKDLNVLINNAATVHLTDFFKDENALGISNLEFQTNVLAPIHLIKLLFPLLMENNNPAIVNVTTGLVYSPKAVYPFYCATKAALHSFTQTLRFNIQKQDLNCEVIEVLFPAVDTPFHEGKAPRIAISVKAAVDEMINKINSGKPEIRVAGVKRLYILSRFAPQFIFKKINSIV